LSKKRRNEPEANEQEERKKPKGRFSQCYINILFFDVVCLVVAMVSTFVNLEGQGDLSYGTLFTASPQPSAPIISEQGVKLKFAEWTDTHSGYGILSWDSNEVREGILSAKPFGFGASKLVYHVCYVPFSHFCLDTHLILQALVKWEALCCETLCCSS
jgi:hypothetical protein